MMLTYLAPTALTAEQFDALCLSAARPPEACQRQSPQEVAELVLSGRWMVFAVPEGIMAVEVDECPVTRRRRLNTTAMHWKRLGWFYRNFRSAMARLASDLGCDTVQTICFDKRLAAAMQKMGAEVEAWQVVWQVEDWNDGQ